MIIEAFVSVHRSSIVNMETENNGKRKRSVTTIQNKCNALKQVDAGRTISQVATDFGISKVTIRRWIHQRDELEKWSSTKIAASEMKKRSRMQDSVNEELDETLFAWFNEHRLRGTLITGPMIRTQVLKFYEEMGGADDFTASNGWLDRWKKRHGVRQSTMAGEKLLANDASITEFATNILHTINDEQSKSGQIFRCDGNDLDYKITCSKTVVPESEKAASQEKNGTNFNFVNITACHDESDPSKVSSVFIGKSDEPWVFQNLKMEPNSEAHVNKGLMDTEHVTTAREALDGMQRALEYFEKLPGYSIDDLKVLRRAKDLAALNCRIKTEFEWVKTD